MSNTIRIEKFQFIRKLADYEKILDEIRSIIGI